MCKYFTLAVLLGTACFEYSAAVTAEIPKAKPGSPISRMTPKATSDKSKPTESPMVNSLCKERNHYTPIKGNCDAYVECKDYRAIEMLCPDGLHFNPKAVWPDYPCGYPMDVPCQGRGVPQPAKSTEDCPHQYGFFPSAHARADGNCGQYRMCVMGIAIEMMCPVGLAFNPDTARCDWPDLVPSCKVEEFLGFKCPPAPIGEDGQIREMSVNFRYPGDCYAFYSCEKGRPRLLTCDTGFAFDEVAGRCVDAEKVECAKPLV